MSFICRVIGHRFKKVLIGWEVEIFVCTRCGKKSERDAFGKEVKETSNKTGLGEINLRIIRVLAHLGKISQLMIVWLFVADLKSRYGISFWWGILVIPAMYVIHLIDKRWILAGEVDAVTKANPFFIKMDAKLDKLLESKKNEP